MSSPGDLSASFLIRMCGNIRSKYNQVKCGNTIVYVLLSFIELFLCLVCQILGLIQTTDFQRGCTQINHYASIMWAAMSRCVLTMWVRTTPVLWTNVTELCCASVRLMGAALSRCVLTMWERTTPVLWTNVTELCSASVRLMGPALSHFVLQMWECTTPVLWTNVTELSCASVRLMVTAVCAVCGSVKLGLFKLQGILYPQKPLNWDTTNMSSFILDVITRSLAEQSMTESSLEYECEFQKSGAIVEHSSTSCLCKKHDHEKRSHDLKADEGNIDDTDNADKIYGGMNNKELSKANVVENKHHQSQDQKGNNINVHKECRIEERHDNVKNEHHHNSGKNDMHTNTEKLEENHGGTNRRDVSTDMEHIEDRQENISRRHQEPNRNGESPTTGQSHVNNIHHEELKRSDLANSDANLSYCSHGYSRINNHPDFPTEHPEDSSSLSVRDSNMVDTSEDIHKLQILAPGHTSDPKKALAWRSLFPTSECLIPMTSAAQAFALGEALKEKRVDKKGRDAYEVDTVLVMLSQWNVINAKARHYALDRANLLYLAICYGWSYALQRVGSPTRPALATGDERIEHPPLRSDDDHLSHQGSLDRQSEMSQSKPPLKRLSSNGHPTLERQSSHESQSNPLQRLISGDWYTSRFNPIANERHPTLRRQGIQTVWHSNPLQRQTSADHSSYSNASSAASVARSSPGPPQRSWFSHSQNSVYSESQDTQLTGSSVYRNQFFQRPNKSNSYNRQSFPPNRYLRMRPVKGFEFPPLDRSLSHHIRDIDMRL